jgi:hypothetical protein
MKPHKHAKLIKAWADGAEIQYRINGGSWFDIQRPNWGDYTEYRIRQNKRKYRVAELQDVSHKSIYTSTADTLVDEKIFIESPHFVRWLTDWIEYDATNQEPK